MWPYYRSHRYQKTKIFLFPFAKLLCLFLLITTTSITEQLSLQRSGHTDSCYSRYESSLQGGFGQTLHNLTHFRIALYDFRSNQLAGQSHGN